MRFFTSSFAKMFAALALTILAAGAVSADAKKPLAGYNSIVVRQFTVEQTDKTLGFTPRMLAQMRTDIVDGLQGRRIFDEVILEPETSETSNAAPAEPSTTTAPERRLLLSGTVVEFSKGSRAARAMIGFGAGASKIKMNFVFRDGQTGEELLRSQRTGKFSGWFTAVGGDQREALADASNDVVEGLIKDIIKNR